MNPFRVRALLAALLSCLVCLFLLPVDHAANAAVSPATEFSYDGKNVRVKVYSRDVGEAKDHVVFKYGDLLHRATAYKTAHPEADVKVRFAMYKIGMGSYIGVDPGDSSYGYVKGAAGAHLENLVDLIIDAAAHKVDVGFVYHKDNDPSASVKAYIESHENDPTVGDPSQTVGNYLDPHQIEWGGDSFEQMHSKFMTVSHYAGDDGGLVADTVYTSTGNIDDHTAAGLPIGKDWVQSGLLINGHPELRASFEHYFDLIYNNYENQTSFRTAVRAAHAAGTLNYDDQHFSSYFYPIPEEPEGHYVYIPETGDGDPSNGNAWDPAYNPIAKYVEQMADATGDRYFKANVYHLKTDNFGHKLYDRLKEIYDSSTPGLKHFRFVVKTNSYETQFPISNFNNIGIAKYKRLTHAKDYLFALSGESKYFTVTGSANLKLDEYASKANNSVVIKETDPAHPVYSAYKEIYEYQYAD